MSWKRTPQLIHWQFAPFLLDMVVVYINVHTRNKKESLPFSFVLFWSPDPLPLPLPPNVEESVYIVQQEGLRDLFNHQ